MAFRVRGMHGRAAPGREAAALANRFALRVPGGWKISPTGDAANVSFYGKGQLWVEESFLLFLRNFFAGMCLTAAGTASGRL